jgi:hypothetical protein
MADAAQRYAAAEGDVVERLGEALEPYLARL